MARLGLRLRVRANVWRSRPSLIETFFFGNLLEQAKYNDYFSGSEIGLRSRPLRQKVSAPVFPYKSASTDAHGALCRRSCAGPWDFICSGDRRRIVSGCAR